MYNKALIAALNVIILAFFSTFTAAAQSQEKIYSLLILNFAKGIHWPAPGGHHDAFVIGVVDYPPLVAELTAVTEKTKINGKRMIVKPVSDLKESPGCHILFLPAYKAKLLPAVIAQIPTHPTLIVCNKSDAARKGAGINFLLLDGKLNYEINCVEIEKRGMKVSSTLKSAGRIVN
jgi:hypothetical protein